MKNSFLSFPFSKDHTRSKAFFLLLTLAMDLGGGQYFIAPDGNDANPGTLLEPKATVSASLNLLIAGETLLVRGGT